MQCKCTLYLKIDRLRPIESRNLITDSVVRRKEMFEVVSFCLFKRDCVNSLAPQNSIWECKNIPEIADNQVGRWRWCNISLAQYSTTSHPQMQTLAPFLYAPLLAQYILNEIKQLVSTHGGGGYSGPTQIQSPSIWDTAISLHTRGRGVLSTNSDPKSLNLGYSN